MSYVKVNAGTYGRLEEIRSLLLLANKTEHRVSAKRAIRDAVMLAEELELLEDDRNPVKVAM